MFWRFRRRPGVIRTLVLAATVLTTHPLASARPPAKHAGDDSELRDYLSANGFLNRGLYELAAKEYRSFLANHPRHEKNADARYGLAVSLYRMSDQEGALKELEPLLKLEDFEYRSEVLTIAGQCHLALQQFGPAADSFESVVQNHTDHELAPSAAAGLIESDYRAGQYDQAVRHAQEAVKRWPDGAQDERIRFFWSMALLAKKDYAQAAAQFDALLQEHAQGVFADRSRLLLAQSLHHAGDLQNAQRRYRDVLERAQPEFVPDALMGLASILLDEKQPGEAGELLDRLMREFPDSEHTPQAKMHRARAWFDQGQFQEAFDEYGQVSDRFPALAEEAQYRMAKCELRLGKNAEAAERLAQGAESDRDQALQPQMQYDRAVALLRADQKPEAIHALEKFLERFPDHELVPDALHLAANLEHELGRHDPCRRHCRRFLNSFADHRLAASVAFLAAENEFIDGRYEESIRLFEAFLSRHGDDAQAPLARFRMGLANYRLEKFDASDELLKEFTTDHEGDPRLHSAYLVRGDIQFQRGEWKIAERLLRHYLANGLKVPQADEALLKQGLCLERQTKNEEALKSFDALIESFPQSEYRVHARFERGQVLVELHRPDDAAEAFEQVLAEGGESRFATHALNYLGSIAMGANDYESAAKRFQGVAKASSDKGAAADALFQSGVALLAAREFAQAEATFKEFLDRYPADDSAPEARARLALAQSRQDRCEEAIKSASDIDDSQFAQLDGSLAGMVRYEQAWCLRTTGNVERASQTYQRLIDSNASASTRTHAMLELAAIEADAGRHEQAEKLLRSMQSLKSDEGEDSPEIWEQSQFRLGLSLFELERWKDSAEAFQAFLRQYPDSAMAAQASYLCGESLFKTGNHQRASEFLQRVIDRFDSDPVYDHSLLRQGECLCILQKWSAAEHVFTLFLEKFPDAEQWYQARFGVGWARENLGRYDEAIKAYQVVVDRHQGPTAARAQFQIGECLFAKKQYEDAVAELLKVDLLYAYPEWSAAALFEAGRCFEKMNKTGEARDQFTQVTKRFGKTQWSKPAEERLEALASVSASSLPGR